MHINIEILFSSDEIAMKALVVAVYQEFESAELSEMRIEQVEGLIGHPVDQSMMLEFKRLIASQYIFRLSSTLRILLSEYTACSGATRVY